MDERLDLGLEARAARHAEDRRSHREAGLGPARSLRQVEAFGSREHQRLHGGVVGGVGLHDDAPVLAGPCGRLEPGHQRAFASVHPRAAERGVGVQDAHQVEPESPEVLQGVDAAHQHLAFVRRARRVVTTHQRHGHGGDAASPLLDALGSPADNAEVGPAARGAPSRRLAHHASDAPSFQTEQAEARRAGGRLSAGATDPRHPVAANGFEQERARGGTQRSDQPGRAPFWSGLDHLDGRPGPADRFDRDVVEHRGFERRAERAQDAHGALEVRPHPSDVADVVRG